MAGQGTAALELIEDGGELDRAARAGRRRRADRRAAPTAATALCPDVRAWSGVEPEVGDDTRRSLAAGERVRVAGRAHDRRRPAARHPGRAHLPGRAASASRRVETVSDAEIVDAMRFAFERAQARPGAERRHRALARAPGRPRRRRRPARRRDPRRGGNVDVARFRALTSA